jgi:hypothetical protein
MLDLPNRYSNSWSTIFPLVTFSIILYYRLCLIVFHSLIFFSALFLFCYPLLSSSIPVFSFFSVIRVLLSNVLFYLLIFHVFNTFMLLFLLFLFFIVSCLPFLMPFFLSRPLSLFLLIRPYLLNFIYFFIFYNFFFFSVYALILTSRFSSTTSFSSNLLSSRQTWRNIRANRMALRRR